MKKFPWLPILIVIVTLVALLYAAIVDDEEPKEPKETVTSAADPELIAALEKFEKDAKKAREAIDRYLEKDPLAGLKEEIAKTQRMLEESSEQLKRFNDSIERSLPEPIEPEPEGPVEAPPVEDSVTYSALYNYSHRELVPADTWGDILRDIKITQRKLEEVRYRQRQATNRHLRAVMKIEIEYHDFDKEQLLPFPAQFYSLALTDADRKKFINELKEEGWAIFIEVDFANSGKTWPPYKTYFLMEGVKKKNPSSQN